MTLDARLLAIAALVFGCSKSDPPKPVPAASSTASVDVRSHGERFAIRDPSGAVFMTIKLKEDGAKVVDGSGNEIARLKIEARADGSELKIKAPDEKTLGHVTGSAPKWKLKDEGKQVLFELRRDDDGRYVLEDADKKTIYRIAPKDAGAEIDDGRSVAFRVIVSSRETTIRDASDKTVLTTTDRVSPVALGFLALDKLSKPQAAALFLTLNEQPKR